MKPLANPVGSPLPHPEVVNRHPSVLIVGYGHVGRQMGKWFPEADYVDEDGVIRWQGEREFTAEDAEGAEKKGRDRGEREGTGKGFEYELGFLCVPTPPDYEGHCDTSIVREAYATWDARVRYWCLKSTVSVGTTESLGPNVCMSPEYYGETTLHPLRESLPFIILGGPPEVTRAWATAWTLVTHAETRIYQTDSRTAELCKLMENSWLATKVSFCNQFYDLAGLAGVDWHELRELWLADPRITRSHTYVYPENRGWAGKCLPKDTGNLCAWARKHGRPAKFMESVRAYNRELRGG